MANEIEEIKEKEKAAGCIPSMAVGISFFIPIVGVIAYFIYRKKIDNSICYLKAAGFGFAFFFLTRLLSN